MFGLRVWDLVFWNRFCRNTGSTRDGRVRRRNQVVQGSRRSWWCWEVFGCRLSTQRPRRSRRQACTTRPRATLHSPHNFASRKITSLASTTALPGLPCRCTGNQFSSRSPLKLAHPTLKPRRRYAPNPNPPSSQSLGSGIFCDDVLACSVSDIVAMAVLCRGLCRSQASYQGRLKRPAVKCMRAEKRRRSLRAQAGKVSRSRA